MSISRRIWVTHVTRAILPLLAVLPAANSAETNLPRVKDAAGQPARAMVATKDVCAWPNLTTLPDGTVVATIFNQPSHGSVAGDVDCWATEDGGQTWQRRGTVAPHEPDTNRMNVATGLAANGDLVAICSGWSNRYPPGKSGGAFRAEILDPWVCRSTDGGRTWTINKTAFPSSAPDGGYANIPFGDIVADKNGALHAATYSRRKTPAGAVDRVWIYRSRDNGKTWGDPTAVNQAGSHNETALLHLGDGRWLAAARTHSPADDGRRYHLDLFASHDNAQSWSFQSHVTESNQHPGHLLRLADGTTLLTYGNRTADRGVDVRLSHNRGKTWTGPFRVADFQGDGGYPSSVQLADGRILTAFYASRTATYGGYQMGVVVWDPRTSFTP